MGSSRRFEGSWCLHLKGQEFFGLLDPEVGTAIGHCWPNSTVSCSRRLESAAISLWELKMSHGKRYIFLAVGIKILILGLNILFWSMNRQISQCNINHNCIFRQCLLFSKTCRYVSSNSRSSTRRQPYVSFTTNDNKIFLKKVTLK